jgi:hypothetical protein
VFRERKKKSLAFETCAAVAGKNLAELMEFNAL